MSATTSTRITPGVYSADKIHSNIAFAVRHMVVSTFRGSFADYDAQLTVAEDGSLSVSGEVDVASVQVKDPNLAGHLQSPDFFDAERYPKLSFSSTELNVDDEGRAQLDGALTIKGVTLPVSATGTFSHIAADLRGSERIGLELETTIDRTAYELNWNAQLPNGGIALSNNVTLSIALELTQG